MKHRKPDDKMNHGRDDLAFLENAAATYDDIAANGPASRPLAFDLVPRGRAERVDAFVYNPVTNEAMEVSNIIYERFPDNRPPDRAYWVGRKLKKCIFGVVKECTMLRFRNDAEVPWEVTDGKAAVKIMSWRKIREIRHVEDPLQEVAAMQHVSQDGVHPHVMGVYDVLEDADYLLMFMPFCSSGDLFGYVQQAGRFEEKMARYWFRQILDGLAHLQKMGVCHRDMSLENMLIDEYRTSVIIDLGMCLRIPYEGDNGGVADVTSNRLRRLIRPQVACGKPNYISPEIMQSTAPFDGFAIDLWASAVILFIMLVGLPPWEMARPEDPRYRMVVRGGLEQMLITWNRPISPLAADLLQKMLREDPAHRLSFLEVRDHPWVAEDDTVGDLQMGGAPTDGWRL